MCGREDSLCFSLCSSEAGCAAEGEGGSVRLVYTHHSALGLRSCNKVQCHMPQQHWEAEALEEVSSSRASVPGQRGGPSSLCIQVTIRAEVDLGTHRVTWRVI